MQDNHIQNLLRDLQEGIRHSAVRPNINAYQPHEKQLLFHRSDAIGRLYIGGNRGGKTVGGATESIWWLTQKHPYQHTPEPPIRGRCISVDFTNGVEAIVKPEVRRWLPPSSLVNGSWEDSYNSHTRTLELANGSFLEFKSYDQDLDKHAGTSRHFVWFDEEPPHSIFEENMMRLIDTGGHWWLTMTPVEGYTWVAEEIYEPAISGANPDVYVVEVDMTDNPHLNQAAIDQAMSYLGEDERKARKEGKFVIQGGLIFPMFDGTKHTIDKMIYSPSDRNVRLMCSMDLGIRNPTAWMWHLLDDTGTLFTFHEKFESGLTIPEWSQIVKGFEKQLKRYPDLRVGDPSITQRAAQTGLSNQRAYAQEGVYIALANNDWEAGVYKMMDYLNQGKWFIHSSCVNLIREMRRYKRKEWESRKLKDKNNIKEEPQKKDDHAIDACRYLFSFLPDLARSEVTQDKKWLNEAVARNLNARPSVDVTKPRLDMNLVAPKTEWREIETEWGLNE